MFKKKTETYEEFMKNNFVACPHCGYNNKYETFIKFGTCLRCLQIIDDRVYFKNRLGIERRKQMKEAK